MSEKSCEHHIMKEINDGYKVCVQCGKKFATVNILVEVSKLPKLMETLGGINNE